MSLCARLLASLLVVFACGTGEPSIDHLASGGKADGTGSFANLVTLLTPADPFDAFERPPIAVRYGFPAQAFQIKVEAVDAPYGFQDVAHAYSADILNLYDTSTNVLDYIDSDIELTVQYGQNHAELQRYFLNTLVDRDIRPEVTALLADAYFFRLTLNDASAELFGRELYVISPSLSGADGRVLVVTMEYSEVY